MLLSFGKNEEVPLALSHQWAFRLFSTRSAPRTHECQLLRAAVITPGQVMHSKRRPSVSGVKSFTRLRLSAPSCNLYNHSCRIVEFTSTYNRGERLELFHKKF